MNTVLKSMLLAGLEFILIWNLYYSYDSVYKVRDSIWNRKIVQVIIQVMRE